VNSADIILAADASLNTSHSPLATEFLIATDDPTRIGILSDHRESKELSSGLVRHRKPSAGNKAKKKLIATKNVFLQFSLLDIHDSQNSGCNPRLATGRSSRQWATDHNTLWRAGVYPRHKPARNWPTSSCAGTSACPEWFCERAQTLTLPFDAMKRKLTASGQRVKSTVLELEFEAEQPIKMEFFERQPLLELFATGRFEFHHHFSFLHIHQDAPRCHGFRCEQTSREFFGALPRQAGQCVLRDVTRHRISRTFRSGSAALRRQTPGIATSSDANVKPSDTLAREK
jgi:hypothetical protein